MWRTATIRGLVETPNFYVITLPAGQKKFWLTQMSKLEASFETLMNTGFQEKSRTEKSSWH